MVKSFESVFPVVKAAAGAKSQHNSGVKRRREEHDSDDAPPPVTSARRQRDDDEGSGFVPPARVERGGRGRGAQTRGGRGGLERGGRGAQSRGGRGGLERGGRGAQSRGGRGGLERGGRGAQSRGGRGGLERGGRGGAGRVEGHSDAQPPTTGGVPQPHSLHVVTTQTANGSEVPMKLNNKVFVDGLPYNYEPQPGQPSLEAEVLQFASTWKVGTALRLIKRSGQGFGFIVFKSPHSVATAVRVLHGRKFLGRALRVEEPKPRDLEKINEVSEMKDLGKSSFQRQVLLSDLNKISQPEMLRELLKEYAPQLEKKLEMIKMTAKNRKAFLTFDSAADAESAVQFLDGLQLLGRRVAAAMAAAPGSLPYSKQPLPPSRGLPQQQQQQQQNSDYGALDVVPLGLEAPSSSPSFNGNSSIKPSAAHTLPPHRGKYNLEDDGPCEIMVGNLPDEVTEEDLRRHFSGCGAIRSCSIIVHPDTHLSMGLASITFAIPAYAAFARETLHGSRLRGALIRVDRGDEEDHPVPDETAPVEENTEEYDEEQVYRRYGVKDKAAFFKGTSFEEKTAASPSAAAKKAKKARQEEAAPALPFDDDEDDDDEEERFEDVDDAFATATTTGGKKNKKASGRKQVAAKKEGAVTKKVKYLKKKG